MNEFEQRQAAEEPLQDFTAEFPGAKRRRIVIGLVALFVVVVLVVGAVLFTGMNNRIHRLDRTTATQSQQIQHLQTSLNAVDASLGAAVACLQTVGSLQGLCSKLVK
jgi:predicted PurR-regulated permease PerM